MKEDFPEVCICAAVVASDGQVIRGHRHADCMRTIVGRGLSPRKGPDTQGFITSRNRYVDRREGRRLQDAAGIESADPKGYAREGLFSEDLHYEVAPETGSILKLEPEVTDTQIVDWIEDFILTGVIETAFELDGGVHLTLSTVGDRESVAYREQNSFRDAVINAMKAQKGRRP